MRKSLVVWLSLLLTMSLVLAACSGGSGGSGSGSAGQEGEAGAETTSPKNESATNSKESEAKPAEKVELDFWTFWGSETRRPIIEHIVDEFNKSQDRIVVKHTFLPWGDIWTKNTAAIAAGDPPDVIVNDINAVAHRAANGQVTNLSEYLAKDNVQDQFYPELWKTVLYEGDAYALPFNTDTRFLFYNKAAFKEAGLDPEKPPTTWAELEEYAKKLDQKQGNRYTRIGFYPLWGNFGYDAWMINTEPNGLSYFDYDTGEVTINTPAKVEALKWINSWTERLGQTNVDAFKAEFGSQQADPFISGKVAMIVTTGTFYTQLRDYGQHIDFGVAPVPEKTAGNGHWSSGGGFVVEIPKGASHPDEAWEFLKWLGGKQAQEYWAVKNFDNVANIEAAETAAGNSELSDKGKEVYQMAVDNMEWTKLSPVPLEAPEYWNLKNPQMDAALLGQKTPEEALAQAQKEVEELIQRNKKQ
ncbi:ABC transporter substrate-binding protein [Paenibacillus sp.]|uniref:ABC transporter substrate-binding protein n=1 Tax=Paenibacillus sp. TaxID=58172 RepID=UPI002D5D80E8|nr:ABC transporter substrate-binding protein [Paenibacillus sp.]HZG87090.1 ABC transporter substrate-binding protein [Paenibacillus sp.]